MGLLCFAFVPFRSLRSISFPDGQLATILNANIVDKFLFSTEGGGFPQYSIEGPKLYEESRNNAFATPTERKRQRDAQLATDGSLSAAGAFSQKEAQYMFYGAGSELTRLDEREFQLALCIRLRTLPLSLPPHPPHCPCGKMLTHVQEFIEHAFNCDSLSHYTRVHRHNEVRDTIIHVANRFGITTTKEPSFFQYSDGILHRPDIAFHTPTNPIATDVTIAYPSQRNGAAADDAAKRKDRQHKESCAQLGYTFIPFAVELCRGGARGRIKHKDGRRGQGVVVQCSFQNRALKTRGRKRNNQAPPGLLTAVAPRQGPLLSCCCCC